jgi:hypothetical protein
MSLTPSLKFVIGVGGAAEWAHPSYYLFGNGNSGLRAGLGWEEVAAALLCGHPPPFHLTSLGLVPKWQACSARKKCWR